MKKIAQIVTVFVLLLCLSGLENFHYTIFEVATSEKADDFRETEALHISPARKKVSKASFVISYKPFSAPIVSSVPILIGCIKRYSTTSLFLRLRVIRI
jgi:hypothetical protein